MSSWFEESILIYATTVPKHIDVVQAAGSQLFVACCRLPGIHSVRCKALQIAKIAAVLWVDFGRRFARPKNVSYNWGEFWTV